MPEEETTTAVDNADEATEVATPEAAPTEEAKADADTESEPESEEEPTAKPKLTTEQKKIAKQEKAFRDIRRENKRLSKMLEQSIENTSKAKPKIEPPKIENFDSMDEYLDARDEYRDSKREATKETKQVNPTSESFDDMVLYGAEKYDDFEDVIHANSSKITPAMAESVLDIDDPDIQADVAYFLGSNPKEAARIAKLSERRQMAEIGKLEIKVETKPAVKQASKAPKPIKPVGGTKTSNDEIQPVESYESFLKKRNKQIGR